MGGRPSSPLDKQQRQYLRGEQWRGELGLAGRGPAVGMPEALSSLSQSIQERSRTALVWCFVEIYFFLFLIYLDYFTSHCYPLP